MTENEIGKIIVNWAARIQNFGDALMKEGISRILNGRVEWIIVPWCLCENELKLLPIASIIGGEP